MSQKMFFVFCLSICLSSVDCVSVKLFHSLALLLLSYTQTHNAHALFLSLPLSLCLKCVKLLHCVVWEQSEITCCDVCVCICDMCVRVVLTCVTLFFSVCFLCVLCVCVDVCSYCVAVCLWGWLFVCNFLSVKSIINTERGGKSTVLASKFSTGILIKIPDEWPFLWDYTESEQARNLFPSLLAPSAFSFTLLCLQPRSICLWNPLCFSFSSNGLGPCV